MGKCRVTLEEKHRKGVLRQRRFRSKLLNIGGQLERWRYLKELYDCSNEDLARMLIDRFMEDSSMVNLSQGSGKTGSSTMVLADESGEACSLVSTQSGHADCADSQVRCDVKEYNSGTLVTLGNKARNISMSNEMPLVLKMEVEDDGYNVCALDHDSTIPNTWDKAISEISCENRMVQKTYNDGDDSETSLHETSLNDDFVADRNFPTGSDWEGRKKCSVSIFHHKDTQDDPDFVQSESDDLEYEDDVSGDPDFMNFKKQKVKKKQNPPKEPKVKIPKAKKSKKEKPYKEKTISKGFYMLDDGCHTIVSVKFQPYLEVVREDVDTSAPSGHSSSVPVMEPCENGAVGVVGGQSERRKADASCPKPPVSLVKYRCKVCGYSSKSLSVTRWHISRVELQEPSMCSECGDVLPNNHQLYVHKKQEHENRKVVKKIYPCSYEGCSFTAKNKLQTKKHMDSVHENRRDHPCTWEGCEKCFKDPYALRVHMRIHNDDKPIICYLCGFRCRQKSSLNWHMKTKHPTDNDGRTRENV